MDVGRVPYVHIWLANYQYDMCCLTPLPDLKPFRQVIDACLDPSPLARVSYYTANVHRAGDVAKSHVEQWRFNSSR